MWSPGCRTYNGKCAETFLYRESFKIVTFVSLTKPNGLGTTTPVQSHGLMACSVSWELIMQHFQPRDTMVTMDILA